LDSVLVLDESAFSAAKSARLGRILRLFPGVDYRITDQLAIG